MIAIVYKLSSLPAFPEKSTSNTSQFSLHERPSPNFFEFMPGYLAQSEHDFDALIPDARVHENAR
jgi:hypothetical protein